MTFETMHSAQAQSRKVWETRENDFLDFLVTIVATLREVRIIYISSLIPSQVPTFQAVCQYIDKYFSSVLIEILFTNGRRHSCKTAHSETKSPQ